jgi:hypothetical protein
VGERLFFDFDDFAALVLATLGAGTVRQLLLMAVGAIGQTRLLQMIVGATRGSALFRMASFGIWHVKEISYSKKIVIALNS